MVEAAATQWIAKAPLLVRRHHHERNRLRLDGAQLGNGDLPVGQDLEQQRLKLLIHLVQLVDQQDDWFGSEERLEKWALYEEVQRMEPVPERIPFLVDRFGLRFQEQALQRFVE